MPKQVIRGAEIEIAYVATRIASVTCAGGAYPIPTSEDADEMAAALLTLLRFRFPLAQFPVARAALEPWVRKD